MKYSEIIIQDHEFTRSVNIQFDISNEKKLGGFIPNATTIALLKDYFVDITNAKSFNHARILYGSYGTGKSHFLTVLSSLLGKFHNNGIAHKTFVERISKWDEFLTMKVKEFSLISKPFLIVPIVFDFEDFNRCITFSLNKALNDLEIDYCIGSVFSKALEIIFQWQKDKDSNGRFITVCDKLEASIGGLISGLKAEDPLAFGVFKSVFKDVTYGMEFLYEPTNIVDNLNSINSLISDRFSGIVFIFDEFGRYLEDNIKHFKIKQLQDFAEYCDHSGYNNHLILVSHKQISQYTQKLSKSIIDEWKKVEGRFASSSINDKRDQCLSLIGSILTKREDYWKEFVSEFYEKFEKIQREVVEFKGFLISTNDDNPVFSSYPLHPITLYSLDKLSKKVAQNERTFFTYLSSRDEYGVCEFLESTDTNDGFHYLGVDALFDYFESSLKASPTEAIYNVYKQYKQSLSKLKSIAKNVDVEVRVLKAIAIIKIIDEPDVIQANNLFLNQIIDLPEERVINATKMLADNRIIKYSRVFNQYLFYEASIIDLDKLVDDNIREITVESVISMLNMDFANFVVYPHEYNSKYKIKRVFAPVFVSQKEAISNIVKKGALSSFDGIVAFVLNDESATWNSAISSMDEKNVLYIALLDTRELLFEVKRYIAICAIESIQESLEKEDPIIKEEIAFYKNEQYQVVQQLIKEWKSAHSDSTILAYDGLEISHMGKISELKLSKIASDIMNNVFSKTLIVNNDMLNKNNITGAMTAAKRSVIDKIINRVDEKFYYGLPVLSPEYTCFRSVIVRNGLYFYDPSIVVDNETKSIANEIVAIVNDFIDKSQLEEQSFAILLNKLIAAPYGLRKGYISLLFAYLSREFIPNMVVQSYGVDQIINSDLFEKIVEHPNDFTIRINNWTEEEESFIAGLEKLFEVNGNHLLGTNRLKFLYDTMCGHYRSISKYARQTQNVCDATNKYRKLIEKTYKDYNTFFFGKLFKLGNDAESCIMLISYIKNELQNEVLRNLISSLRQDFMSVIGDGKEDAVESIAIAFYDDFCFGVTKSFDYYTNTFVLYLSEIKSSHPVNDEKIIADIAKMLTGFSVEYWTDKQYNEFLERLENVKQVLSTNKFIPQNNEEDIKINICANQEERTLTFEKRQLSTIAKTVKNKILSSIRNFGGAISYEEKMQVLLDILQEEIKNK